MEEHDQLFVSPTMGDPKPEPKLITCEGGIVSQPMGMGAPEEELVDGEQPTDL